MGLDLEDFLGGLGAGMSKLGEVKDERRKEKLAQQLEEKRNQDAENREIRREERRDILERKTVRSIRMKPVEGGMYMVEELNSYNELAKPPRPATPDEVAQHNREEKKGDLSITALETNIEADRANIRRANAETDYIPEKRGLERRLTEAQIRNLDEPNRADPADKVPTPQQESMERGLELLSMARASIGKLGKDGKTVNTPTSVAKELAAMGYPELAKRIDANYDK